MNNKRIAVCFFGITRSLSFTIESIRKNVVSPANTVGDTRIFAHLFKQQSIDNPRSGEVGPLNPNEFRLLDADWLELEEPGECLDFLGYSRYLSRRDPWSDGHRSISNLLHQLHSLNLVGNAASAWDPDVYLFVRPDLRYLDSHGVFIRQAAQERHPTIFYPNWQHHGGMNDRFAIVSGAEAAKVYSTRVNFVWQFFEGSEGVFNGERLLKYLTLKFGVRTAPIYARAERVRNNGEIRKESFRRPKSTLNKTSVGYYIRRVIGGNP